MRKFRLFSFGSTTGGDEGEGGPTWNDVGKLRSDIEDEESRQASRCAREPSEIVATR